MDTLSAASKLMLLFKGRENMRGVAKLDGTQRGSDGKVNAKYSVKREPYTIEHWIAHVEGETGIGLVPIMLDNHCYWGAIDIDNYGMTHQDKVDLLKTIEDLGFPFNVIHSKSGGFHCYMIVEDKVTARKMRSVILETARRLGKAKCEVYPKQFEINADKEIGNFLNMPYFNKTERIAIKLNEDRTDFSSLSIDEFLTAPRVLTAEQFDNIFASLVAVDINSEYHDDLLKGMPYCLPIILRKGIIEGQRDCVFYNIGVYLFKRFNEVTPEKLFEYNKYVKTEPLTMADLTKISRSLNKADGDYQYQCRGDILCAHCNSDKCVRQQYGIDVGEGMPNISGLTKIENIENPIYIMHTSVDNGTGRESDLYLTVDDLLDNKLFRKAMCSQLNKLTPRIKADKWDAFIQGYMDNLKIKEPKEVGLDDMCLEETIRDQLITYLEENASSTKDYLLTPGGVWISKDGRVYFLMDDFRNYLIKNKVIPASYSKIKLSDILDSLSVGKQQLNIGNSSRRCRFISQDNLRCLGDDIDMSDEMEVV